MNQRWSGSSVGARRVREICTMLAQQFEEAKTEIANLRDEVRSDWQDLNADQFFEGSYRIWGILGNVSGACAELGKKAEIAENTFSRLESGRF